MRTWTEDSAGSPDLAWTLLSRPREWSTWAPHVRGAWGLGEEVAAGSVGAVRLLGVVPVPVRITAVNPSPPTRAWSWRVGVAVEMEHRVEPRAGGGCTVALDLRAPAPAEAALAAAYGPVISLTLRRLARVIEPA